MYRTHTCFIDKRSAKSIFIDKRFEESNYLFSTAKYCNLEWLNNPLKRNILSVCRNISSKFQSIITGTLLHVQGIGRG